MQIIKGKVENIETMEMGVHVKTVVDLKGAGRARAFIEFRGPNMMEHLKDIQVNDPVEVIASLEASKSRAGVRFNNLIALAIKKL